MKSITLSRSEYRDKNRACWIGKNIGGTLGAPWECRKHAFDFTFYHPVPEKAAPNDDLDLQLVWLKATEDRGIDPSVRTLAAYWEKYAAVYPWNEYGFFMRNYRRGLRPPMAGCFENYFVDEMGSPIRSEIWACLIRYTLLSWFFFQASTCLGFVFQLDLLPLASSSVLCYTG